MTHAPPSPPLPPPQAEPRSDSGSTPAVDRVTPVDRVGPGSGPIPVDEGEGSVRFPRRRPATSGSPWPLVALAAAAVKGTSPGPAFYLQNPDRAARPPLPDRQNPDDAPRLRGPVRHPLEPEGGRPGDPGRAGAPGHAPGRTPALVNVLPGRDESRRPPARTARSHRRPRVGPCRARVRRAIDRPPRRDRLAQLFKLPADSDVDSVRRKVLYDLYYIRHAPSSSTSGCSPGRRARRRALGPRLLRRLFRLPDRLQVAAVLAARSPDGRRARHSRGGVSGTRPTSTPSNAARTSLSHRQSQR